MRTVAITLAASLLASGLSADPNGAADKKTLTLDSARRVMAVAREEARRLNAPGGAIAVADDGGHLLLLERLDGTFPMASTISIGKARTAAVFQRPTRMFEEAIRGGRTAMVALPDFTPLQGGVPITIGGQVVGAVGVSGAATADQDTLIAEAAARALESAGASAAAEALPILFFDRERVAEAFRSGAVLVDGSGGRSYQIHASRREAPGMAEVHAEETDIIYVQEGTATLVTGGTVVDGKETGPGEIRGASIRGGQSRRLGKGDVMIVPRGTPHWFQEVRGPFTYYVVKVR